MDNDILARMEAEEADLTQKLEAVRQFLAVYRGGVRPSGPARGTEGRAPRKTKTLEERMDKFGPYGQRVVDTVLKLLPGDGGNPVVTRALVEHLKALNVEITGNNKVNSLSALLARSSKIKGYGRSGWTLKSDTAGSLYRLILDESVHDENEAPNGDPPEPQKHAGWGVQPPQTAPINPISVPAG